MDHEFVERQKRILAEVARLVERRAAGEGNIDQQQSARDEKILASYQERRTQLTAEFEAAAAKLRGEYSKKREETIFTYESGCYEVVQESERFHKQANADHEQALSRAKHAWTVARRVAQDEFDEVKDRPKQGFERFQRRCEAKSAEFDLIVQHANRVLRRRGCPALDETPIDVEEPTSDPMETVQGYLATAQQKLLEMERQPAAKFLEDGWPFLIFLFASIGLMLLWFLLLPLMFDKNSWGLSTSMNLGIGIGGSLAIGTIAGVVIRQVMRPKAAAQTLAVVPEIERTVASAKSMMTVAIRQAREEADHKFDELVERREDALSEAHAAWSRARVELTEQHQKKVKEATENFKSRRRQLKETYEQELQTWEEQYPPQIQQCEEQFAKDSQALIEDRKRQLEESQRQAAEQWETLVRDWAAGLDAFEAEVDDMNAICEKHFPDWESIDWREWNPGDEDLPALRFGNFKFALDSLPNGLSKNEKLQRERTKFDLPTVLSYPDCPSLMYLSENDGRDEATVSLQNVMLRLLTSLPAGKVRFTIIDPTGLGQNFSAFMHLADFDERLVSSRIWTEAVHINKRLADLTEHMENVIQKYLRNEFESIQQYNQHAGEVAEPYQILVIANFPANFNEESARRLVSIATSGARCGVYTLISVDTKLKMPQNFDLLDLQANAATLPWDSELGRYRWKDKPLSDLPLVLESPPEGDRFTDIVRIIGERAKDASRVEVPFSTVAAADDHWWESDSRAELVVPLGRAGATNLQYMRLGKGTSQHVLMAGKTGSGKSTLLHALITNLSTYYSPHEVQFYLIDFKKGVEFKAYAAFGLPHARVIAIESEREFGMSVLQRLDIELKNRGDRFRGAGVQDLKGYRDTHPDEHVPRLMLIIDEFQEFFVKDDKIAQEASLLLDRLVRQGRAFGIHVLLGSQTLAGAYSLARSTLGQMAVRVALQCSETDAHLILSDDNTAARLLGRPGEAIYNDSNGAFEGNHPFQVVWLPDHEREKYLQRMAEMAEQREYRLPAPIVFEGNAPADPSKNELLRVALETAEPSAPALAPRAWLGEAVAIKDPAAAIFTRQSGSNLLMVGQDESLALGVMANCVISLSAELRTDNDSQPAQSDSHLPRFVILDGQRAESPMAGFWDRLSGQLPCSMDVAGGRDISKQIMQLADEVDRRLAENQDSAPPVFLFIFNLSRFRDLRKSDEYKFSFEEDATVSLDQRMATILREGPAYGVHTLIWSDTYTNVGRWIDRQSMNDLSWRVLFQMSATDSANLMESPEASRLGVHRAILYNEEQGEFEKFRPYGPPTADWLAWVKERLGVSQAM